MGRGDIERRSRSFLDRTDGPTTLDRLPGLIVGGSIASVAIIAMASMVVAVLGMLAIVGVVVLVGLSKIERK